MREIVWGKNLQESTREVTGGTRLPLLFFYRGEGDEGSKKMINETLVDEKVVAAVEREGAPLKYDILVAQEEARRYRIDWTPTFIFTDDNGNELERWVGYLPGEEFIAQLCLSKGLAAFHLNRFKEAEREFEMLIDEHPTSELVPEAEYFLGVAKFKETGDSYPLAELCHTLQEKYPASIWTKKCSIWGTIGPGQRARYVAFDQGGAAASGAY